MVSIYFKVIISKVKVKVTFKTNIVRLIASELFDLQSLNLAGMLVMTRRRFIQVWMAVCQKDKDDP